MIRALPRSYHGPSKADLFSILMPGPKSVPVEEAVLRLNMIVDEIEVLIGELRGWKRWDWVLDTV